MKDTHYRISVILPVSQSYWYNNTCILFTASTTLFADTDECTAIPALCRPGGTCINILNGGFYSCTCGDGYRNNGLPASDLMETCVGMYY